MINLSKNHLKRVISSALVCTMTATMLQCFPDNRFLVNAEETNQKYPYTMFAASSNEGAITVNANNFCVNGNVAANGTIVSSGNTNINGTRTEQAAEEMLYIFDKIDSKYFTGSNVEEYTEDYTLEEMNININNPVEVEGDATLTGNININSALKALENVELYGEVKNTNDSLIFSKYGDIIIESQNVNLNGLVYAPFGDVVVTAQNLNLNNVVIIADTITFECPSVNANYSNSVAEFAGSVSDSLNIPYEEYKYLKDTDEDDLPDIIESQIDTDPENNDTDGDILPDGYEVFVTRTDPTLDDTDANNIADGDEDFDVDGLANLEEYTRNTNPWSDDSDDDGLKDEEEVTKYFTDPSKKDTDDDGLEDGEEIYLADFGFIPTTPDSDGDGIFDGDERFEQTIEQDINVEDDKISAVTKVSVTFNCPGVIDNQVTLENMYNVDVLSSNVVGMVGAPIDITSSVDFDNATITFTYDEALLNGTPEENLAILWYDENNDRYVILDEDTVVDVENNTVSYTTTHFSTYLVIDREVWYDCWRENIDYRNSSTFNTEYDIGFVVDVSGSMDGDRLDRAKTALNTFIDAMYPCDNACLVKFNDHGTVVSEYGSTISELKSAVSTLYAYGGTSTNSGLSEAFNELSLNLSDDKTAMIILICDGDVEYNAATMVLINKAINNNIAIHTINVCDSASSVLSEISEKTGGTYYIAKTSSEIASVMATLQQKTVSSIDMTDSDGDGLYDVYEVNGMKIQNGQIIKTDPYTADSDNDGMSDFDEIGGAPVNEVVKFFKSEYSCVLFESKSNPWTSDSDGDYYPDNIDKLKNIWNKSSIKDKYIDDTDSANGKSPVESADVYTNGVLTQITMGEGGTMKKNAYSFIRSNDSKYIHEGYSSTFSITPEKNSFYAITVSDVNSIDDVDIKVTYVKDGFWFITKDKTITVKQWETATYANGEATFYFYLESGMDNSHEIQINNNSGCSTYNVTVSQDNWVYAPDGGIWEVVEYSNRSIWGNHLYSEKLYMPAPRIVSAICELTGGTEVKIDPNGDVESQINSVLLNNGMIVTEEELDGAITTITGATATTVLFFLPIPGTKVTGGVKAVQLITSTVANICTYKGTPSAIETLEAYMEQYGFKRAFTEGNANVSAAKYYTQIGRVWDPWLNSPYIYKYSNMGDIGKVNINITNSEIIDWCDWKKEESA